MNVNHALRKRMFVQKPQHHSMIVNVWFHRLLGDLKVSKPCSQFCQWRSYILLCRAQTKCRSNGHHQCHFPSTCYIHSIPFQHPNIFKSVSRRAPGNSRRRSQGIRTNQSCAGSSRKRKGISADDNEARGNCKPGTSMKFSVSCERLGSKVRSRRTPSPK